jgi:probable F420-dependent oxidoreductase
VRRAVRYGITIPFDGIPLDDQLPWFSELEELGYTDLWSSEAASADAFTPLAVASVLAPNAALGTAIVPVFTRGLATLAMSTASLAELAPGRFTLGLGVSSPMIVEQWNGLPFDRPLARMRDTVRFLRRSLAGERVSEEFETFTVRGFRLERVPEQPPPILLAALRPPMLKLAGEEGDGAIAVWLSADDVATIAPFVAGKELVARILVCPSEDEETVRRLGKAAVAMYLNVPAYAAYHRWLGRGDRLEPMWEAWSAGYRTRAIELVPDSVVDELIVHGSPERCRAHVQRYVDNGVTCPVLAIQPYGIDPMDGVRLLAPVGR